MITIVDYGLGNHGSIQGMLNRLGFSSEISGDPERIALARKLILPGVGHFDRAMSEIDRRGLRGLLDRKALEERVPILGICLGMQLLTRGSEEGELPGLAWIPASTLRFRPEPGSALKVPHMGWNEVTSTTPSPLTNGLPEGARFYFVHSYHVQVDDSRHSMLRAVHGIPFEAGIQCGHLFGVQFHPEKSHRFGLMILARFGKLAC
jgi:glutamine amidotransferase